ncbi:hypothetical protein Emed_001117 [Eimeria media]
MAPQDLYKTALRISLSQYESKVMPFGLRGAPGTFQAVTTHRFFPCIGRGVIAYLHDLVVYAPDEATHATLLRKALSIPSDNRLYSKISKCDFGASSPAYLGFTGSSEGVTPSTSRIEAIKVWPDQLPNDICVGQFFGTANYCGIFMGPEFPDVGRSLDELFRNDQKFGWEAKHAAAVQALKTRLINFTNLQVPDPSKAFLLRTAPLGYAIGAVLEQGDKPLGFLTKCMSETEMRYATYDQEFLALIRALKKWRRVLLLAHVTAYTDHQGLQYSLKLRGDKPVRGRAARWLDFVADFEHLSIVYAPGASNTIADSLFRHPGIVPPQKVDAIALGPQEKLLSRLLALHRSELPPLLKRLAATAPQQQCRTTELPPSSAMQPHRMKKLLIGGAECQKAYKTCVFAAAAQRDGGRPFLFLFRDFPHVIKYANDVLSVRPQGLWRRCVRGNVQCKEHMMYQAHDQPTAGHMGVHKTYDYLARLCYRVGMRAYVMTYGVSWPRCGAADHIPAERQGLVESLGYLNRRRSTFSLDSITGLPDVGPAA